MRPEVHLAKRLSKIFCLWLVSWEQRIMMKTQSGSLKSYLREKSCLSSCTYGGNVSKVWRTDIDHFSDRFNWQQVWAPFKLINGHCRVSTVKPGLEKSRRIVAFCDWKLRLCDWKLRLCDQKIWCSRNIVPKTRRPGASLRHMDILHDQILKTKIWNGFRSSTRTCKRERCESC